MKICIREENVSELFLPPAKETVQSLLSYTAEDYFQIEQMRCEELKGVLTAWRKKWSLQKHFNEDSLTPAADMNSTVKVLLLIVCVLMYASIARCASVSRNSIEENQTDIHSIPSNYQLPECK
ncbi:hypothetical protein CEXT_672611 [Caerostris extrusa]|uniref:Uncharacterized protein n=1 Tax=Caerostris extrusa TaxID=172846 RepID=A0AAV4XHS5_CAEEX|nr:hypothetical protein CEXT_672611 [Caerostris extrusa]